MIKRLLTINKKVIVLDIFFISYDEQQKDENFHLVRSRFPRTQRIDGVEGIHRAYFEAFKKSRSSHFFTMDADNRLSEDFEFKAPIGWSEPDEKLYVWRCENAVNKLVYGYGGVKLWPRSLFSLEKDIEYVDFTTTMARKGYEPVQEVASTTNFNTSALFAWRSGFRECAKLAGSAIANQSRETEERLRIWNSVGYDQLYGEWAIIGARMGTLLGMNSRSEALEISIINDFKALEGEFKKIAGIDPKVLLNLKEAELKERGYLINE
jgi:hypothetical protein